MRHWGGQVEQEVSNLSGLFVNNALKMKKTKNFLMMMKIYLSAKEIALAVFFC